FDEMTDQEFEDHMRKVMEASGSLDRALAHLYEFEDQEIICNGMTEEEYNGMTEEEYEEGTIREICSYGYMDPNTFPRMTPEERERYHKIRDDFIEMQNQKNKQ
ncbi:MAG: hypothetical protein RRZ42_05210, partial [Oscillospiraceae bacterium]